MPSDLRFIDENPAMEAFRRGQAVAQQQQAADLAIEGQIVQNAEQFAGAPTRLRTINANADTARANADVAVRTVQPRVSQAQSSASLAGTNADVARQTAPYTVQNAQNSARTGEANADVAVGTVPYTIENARSGSRLNAVNADVGERSADARVRGANAGAVSAEMQGFYKSLDLLNAGQTEAAVEVASQYGQEIPQEVLNNGEVRAAVTRAAKHSQELYPNRPRDQQAFIQGFIKDMAERRAAGQPVNDPTAVYGVTGAPSVPEISTTEQTQKPADVAIAEWLVANKVAPNAQAAWEMVRQSRSNPMLMRTQIYNNALRSTFGNPEKAEEITTKAMQFIGQAGTAQPANPAAPAPATPQQPRAPRYGQTPAQPASVPAGSAFSPSRKMWRSPDGQLFDEAGRPAQ